MKSSLKTATTVVLMVRLGMTEATTAHCKHEGKLSAREIPGKVTAHWGACVIPQTAAP